MTEGPMFKTGVVKFPSKVGMRFLRNLRYLLNIAVHIDQAVLKCEAVEE